MPLYEYECEACGKRFEIIQKFSDAPPDTCRVCGQGPVRRLMSSPAIQFKGTGWYITDYARKSDSATTKSGEAKSDSTAETKSESKTETTSDSKSEKKAD